MNEMLKKVFPNLVALSVGPPPCDSAAIVWSIGAPFEGSSEELDKLVLSRRFEWPVIRHSWKLYYGGKYGDTYLL